MAAISFHPAAEDCVSASDLVRRFGEWQERALTTPVFVMRRGRPALVLTSFDLMRRLCTPDEREPLSERPIYLDSLREPVMWIDEAGRIRDINRAARLAFAGSDRPIGAGLADILPGGIAAFLHDIARRAIRTGTVEHSEIAVERRHYTMTVLPARDHAILIADDISDDAALAIERAKANAVAAAIESHPAVATVHLNLRGYIDGSAGSLARLCGIDPSTLGAIRFVTLIDIASRVAVGEAIEAVFDTRKPCILNAILPRSRTDPLAISIALAPRLIGNECQGASALIVDTGTR